MADSTTGLLERNAQRVRASAHRLAPLVGHLDSLRRRLWAFALRPHPRTRVVLFSLAGALLAVALAGRSHAKIGPFDTTLTARPAMSAGETTIHLAPLGTIVLDTHDWPLVLDLRADQIGLDEAERIARNPALIDTLGDDVADDVRSAMWLLAFRTVLVAVAGGVVGALLARRSLRSALTSVGVSGLLIVSLGVGTAASFDTNAVAEPRYTGLLTQAPTAVGSVEKIVDRFGQYRAQLRDLVGNVVTLYLAAENLPTFQPPDDTIKLLHVSDVHLNPQAFDVMRSVSEQFDVDAIVDTGDLVDWGTQPETEFVDGIGRIDVPYVFVRGNHDSLRIQQAVGEQPNAIVLDDAAADVAGLRIWGIGDPRYTPNKDQEVDPGKESEREAAEAFAPEVAEQLAAAEPPEVDVAMIHDRRAAEDLAGEVPLVLAGHTHKAEESRLGDETVLMVEGSTGGAGLRGLQGQEPEPLTASVLYFDPDTKQLLAYDRLALQGFGGSGVTIQRHVISDATSQ